jgi:ATP-binding cassette, subfamily C, bacterial exporter for protease/lipase
MKIKQQHSKLKEVLHSFKSEYLSIFTFSAVINILMLLPSWYMLEVYDRVLTSRDDNTLLGLSLITIFLYLVYALLERSRGLVLVSVSEGIDAKISPKLHQRILTPGVNSNQGEVVSINDLNTVKQFLTGQPILSFLDTPWVIIYLATIAIIHPGMGLVAFLSAAFLFFLAILNQRLTEGGLSRAQKVSMEERRLIANAASSSDSTVVMGMRPVLQRALKAIRNDYLVNLIVASNRGVNLSAVTKFFRVLIQSAILGYGAYLAIRNEISAGMIIAGSILLGRTLAPIEGVINSWKQLSEFKKSYANLDKVLETVSDQQHTVALGRPEGSYELVNVSLRLREAGAPALQEVNLKIGSGEVVAIIGPSGAGKTSLLKILAGVYAPSSGHVLLDGSDLLHRDKDELGKYIGYLSQSTDLLAGKVSENIARFAQIDSEKVMDAAKKVGAHEMILGLPMGYETVLGDGGAGVSEGQKRRIALARAFYDNPQVYLLDEPGNSLDDAAVANLANAIKNLGSAKAGCIFTTHQINLAQLADKIILIIDGQVRLYGPAKDVLAKIVNK